SREGDVFVACSTLCFGKYPLERVLRVMAELEFSKVDVALHERGPHLRPSEVARDVNAAVQKVRYGPGLTPIAFDAVIHAEEDQYAAQLLAVCRLARLTAAPLVSIPAAAGGTGVEAEVQRLKRLLSIAEKEGVILTVTTETGTLTEDPDTAVQLCQRVPGLGL